MKIGCFALMAPFSDMARQLERVHALGFEFADLTDNHDGSTLGAEYGFAASVSLDSHPSKIRKLCEQNQIAFTSVCAHANLLDPQAPDVYGTNQIIKAVRLAHLLGIKHVITTEGDPKTEFGRALSQEQRIFSICEKLHTPISWAEELEIEILIEPHGMVTSKVDDMEILIGELGHEDVIGVCLDSGNSWLGGSDPLDYIRRFGHRIRHVHWKDMGAEWVARRGTIYGCGMGTIPVGDGEVGVQRVVEALYRSAFDGFTTLEIAGDDCLRVSRERLNAWWNAAQTNEIVVAEAHGGRS